MGWSRKRRTRPWVSVPLSVAGTLHVRVAAPGLVELSLRNGQPGATGTVVLGTLPVGYRPSRPLDVAATSGFLRITQDGTVSIAYRIYSVNPAAAQINVATTGAVSVVSGSIPLGTYVTLKLSHLTTDAMPTSFPGS